MNKKVKKTSKKPTSINPLIGYSSLIPISFKSLFASSFKSLETLNQIAFFLFCLIFSKIMPAIVRPLLKKIQNLKKIPIQKS